MLRRLSLVCIFVPLIIAAFPHSTQAALSLALRRSDYPQGARVAALPATNTEADKLLGPVHRSTFERLQRRDGEGWLQAAVWSFTTGKGAVAQHHQTTFGYGINVFSSAQRARHALADRKLPTRAYKVARLKAYLYEVSDVRQTLAVVFFAYRNVEIEVYYEYYGVAPARISKHLHHDFSAQSSHLAHIARLLVSAIHATPTEIPTDTPTPVPSLTSTPTVMPTVTATTTSRPTSTPTPTPSPTPTATPAGLQVLASMGQATYPPRASAILTVRVTYNLQPVVGAQVQATFYYGLNTVSCSVVTDSTGTAICTESVPTLPDGSVVYITVSVSTPAGDSASTSTTYTVQH